MRARRIGEWWSEEGEFGVVVLMVVMASGGRRRMEGVLWCLREGRRGDWKLQDSQLQLAKAVASCCMAARTGMALAERWAARWRWRATLLPP
jgi:hypothetical protein